MAIDEITVPVNEATNKQIEKALRVAYDGKANNEARGVTWHTWDSRIRILESVLSARQQQTQAPGVCPNHYCEDGCGICRGRQFRATASDATHSRGDDG